MSHLAADKQPNTGWKNGRESGTRCLFAEGDTWLIIEEVVMWDLFALRFMSDNNWFTWYDALCLDGDGAAVKQITRGPTFASVVLTPTREVALTGTHLSAVQANQNATEWNWIWFSCYIRLKTVSCMYTYLYQKLVIHNEFVITQSSSV